MNIKSYISPAPFFGTLLVLAAFGIAMFFEGYQDLHYAPAALSLLVFACLAIIPSFYKGLKVPSAASAVLLFIFWLYVTMSLSWSTVPFASLVTYLIFIALPLTFFAPILSIDKEKWLSLISSGLFCCLIAAALWAVIQFVFYQDVFGNRAHHPLPNPNNLAGLLSLGFIPSLALLLYAKDKSWTLLLSLGLSLLFISGMIATQSRGALIACLIASILLIILLRKHSPNLMQRALLFVVPSTIAFFAMDTITGLEFTTRLIGLSEGSNDGALAARLAIWASSFEMVKDFMWLGAGFGTFYLYYPHYRQAGPDNSTGNWAHMDPLQYWAEMGITAPILFYAIALFIIIRTIKSLKAGDVSVNNRFLITTSFCALCGLFIHTHFTFNLYVMPILITAGTYLAIWYYATSKALPDTSYVLIELSKWQKPFMVFVTCAIALLIGAMSISSAVGQHHLLKADSLLRKGLPEQFVNTIALAEKWAPRSFIDPEVQLASFYNDLIDVGASTLFTTEEQQSLYVQTQELLHIASEMNPAWSEIDYKRGVMYKTVNPEFEPDAEALAIKSLEIAVIKNKQHYPARRLLSELYLRKGKVEDAYNVIRDGLAYPHTEEVAKEHKRFMKDIKGLVDIKRAYEKNKEQ